jgi:hypothetical protein
MLKKYAILYLAVFLVFISLAAFANKKSLNRDTSERLMGQIDFSSWIKDSLRVNPDSRHAAYATQTGNKLFVAVDVKEGKRYDNIGDPSPH